MSDDYDPINEMIADALVELVGAESDSRRSIDAVSWHVGSSIICTPGIAVIFSVDGGSRDLQVNITTVGIGIEIPHYNNFRFVPGVPDWSDPSFDPMPVIKKAAEWIIDSINLVTPAQTDSSNWDFALESLRASGEAYDHTDMMREYLKLKGTL